VVAVNARGVQEQTLHTIQSVFASPAIGDIDRDGRTDVVIGGANYLEDNSTRGWVYKFELGAGSFAPAYIHWPMFHRDLWNAGYYGMSPNLAVAPASLSILYPVGVEGNAQTNLSVWNQGDGVLSWSIQTDASRISVSPSSGTTSSAAQVVVTVSTNGLGPGVHTVGTIQITGTHDGQQVNGSPVSVPVVVNIAQMQRTFLPMIRSTR
jgi:hypothetical protein